MRALYIGGGFPEKHADVLSANRSFLESIRQAALRGLPIYAECGGLILLARTLALGWQNYPMAGVFPFDVEGFETPQGHGYSELCVDQPNPFFPAGLVLHGHEFHYSRISLGDEPCGYRERCGSGSGMFSETRSCRHEKRDGRLYPPARSGHARMGQRLPGCGAPLRASFRARNLHRRLKRWSSATLSAQ